MTLATVGVLTLASVVPAVPASAAPRPIAHPTGANAVILRVQHSLNGWGGEYPEAFDVTVYGDGRIVIVPPSTSTAPPLPEAIVVRVSEDGIQRLLRGARTAGLLRTTDYGEAGVTDQGTSVIDVDAAGRTRTVDVYALLLPEGDRGLSRAQRLHRRALRGFLHDAADPDFYEGTVIT